MTITLLLAFLRANWKPLLIAVVIMSGVLRWNAYERNIQRQKDAVIIAKLRDKDAVIIAKLRDKDAVIIAKLRDQVVTDSHRLADAAEAFRHIAAIEQANKAAADAQERAGQDALHQSQAQAVRDVARLRGDLARTRAAYRGNVCAAQTLPEGVQ